MGIWDQLNTRTLFGGSRVSSTQLNQQTKDIHIQKKNRELLSDAVLINEASMRDGLPIPGTGKITVTQVSDDSRTTIMQPEVGESLQVMGLSCDRNGGSGDVAYSIYLYDDTSLLFWFYMESSDAGVLFSGDPNYPGFPFYLDNSLYLQATAVGTGGGSFTTVDFEVATVNVR